MPLCRLLITRTAIPFVGLILTLSHVCPGCQVVGVGGKSLPKPVEVKPSSGQPIIKPLSSPQLEYEDDMYNRIDIEKRNYYSQIKRCLSFLVREFGPPIYRGRVTLKITTNPTDNGKMSWSDSRRSYRTITLHELILQEYPTQSDSEFHVLVHELFHAFYQSNAFIKANPDFITEGLAVYAENKYRHSDWSNKKILKEMRVQSKSLASSVKYERIDFGAPFRSYGDRQIDLFYILSGRLFFSQDTEAINEKIRYILEKGSTFHSRKSFDELSKIYGLKRTESFFKRETAVASQLPEPVSLTQNLFDQEKSKQVSGQSKKKWPFVQVGFFTKKKNADSSQKYYRDLGYQTQVRRKKGGYRVLLGPFGTKKEAEKTKLELEKTDPKIHKQIFIDYF